MGTSPSDKFFEFYRRVHPEKFPQMPQTGKEESASASECKWKERKFGTYLVWVGQKKIYLDRASGKI
jgi:hypothetical protein